MVRLIIKNPALTVHKGPKSLAIDAGHAPDCAIFDGPAYGSEECNCTIPNAPKKKTKRKNKA